MAAEAPERSFCVSTAVVVVVVVVVVACKSSCLLLVGRFLPNLRRGLLLLLGEARTTGAGSWAILE